jgi:hypothetical protein
MPLDFSFIQNLVRHKFSPLHSAICLDCLETIVWSLATRWWKSWWTTFQQGDHPFLIVGLLHEFADGALRVLDCIADLATQQLTDLTNIIRIESQVVYPLDRNSRTPRPTCRRSRRRKLTPSA